VRAEEWVGAMVVEVMAGVKEEAEMVVVARVAVAMVVEVRAAESAAVKEEGVKE
jgi:hypothetical protein